MHQTISRLSSIQRERARSQFRQTLLFANLDKLRLEKLIDTVQLLNLHDAEVLFRQQAPASHFYLLSTGQIKLSRNASNGTEKIISLVSPGNTFAEAAIFSDTQAYPVSAISIGDSNIWAINGEVFCEELSQSTDACFALLKSVSQRLYRHVADIERLTLHTASSRLIAYLLAELPGDVSANSAVISLKVPKNAIASRLSIVPATFSRTLSKLSRDGLIEVNEQEIRLLDIASLHEFTDDIVV